MENKNVLSSKETVVLLLSVFIVGFCTIIYELLIGSISSYFLGDSVKQFSIVIGLTMTAMGLGTLISRIINKNLIYYFILIEIILAIVGGLCVPILYFAYTIEAIYYPVMILLILIIGGLIGLEIPLLTRIMEKYYNLKDNISNVLSLDYLGAFIATIVFVYFAMKSGLNPTFKIFLITGFCGGLSTLSALSLELLNFIHSEDYVRAIIYVLSTIIVCTISVLTGIFLVKKYLI